MVLHATNYTQRKQNSITNTIQFLTTLVFFVFLNNLDCFSKTTGVWTVRSGKSSKNATERVVGWHGKCVGCLIWDLHFVCSWQDCFALSTRKNMKTEQFCPPPNPPPPPPSSPLPIPADDFCGGLNGIWSLIPTCRPRLSCCIYFGIFRNLKHLFVLVASISATRYF